MTSGQQEIGKASALGRRKLLGMAALATAVPAAGAFLDKASPAAAATGMPADLPDYLPVPAEAFGPPLTAGGYYVGRIKGNLFWVTDGDYQSLILSTRTGIVLVDAPLIGRKLFPAIDDVARITGRPSKVTHLIYSHHHSDHISASGFFDPSVVRIGHEETRSLLKFYGDPNRPLPQVTFRDKYVLEVGGERVELKYRGPNHTADNIYINFPAYQTLMLVDVVFPGWTPFMNLAVATDIPAWIGAHDVVLDQPWTTFVGGHAGRLGTRADAELQRQYFRDLDASARKALAEVDYTPYYTKYVVNGRNSWAFTREYLDEVARTAAAPVIAAYAGRMAAVDVYTESHATVLIESLRVGNGLVAPQ
jgi:glyoxylase-like metal-dependent hydrolase (beta-lactamase superfamily II)